MATSGGSSEVVKYEYRVDDFVWAKMKGYPPWPGRIMEPKPDMKVTDKKGKQLVFFFGTENYAWISEDQVWPFEEYREQYKQPQRVPKGFADAVAKLEDELKANPPSSSIPRRARTPSPPRSTTSSTDRRSSKGSRKSTAIPGHSDAGSVSKGSVEKKSPSLSANKRAAADGPKFAQPSGSSKKRLLERSPLPNKTDGISSSPFDFGMSSSPAHNRSDRQSETGSARHSSVLAESSFMPDILPMSPVDQVINKNIMPTPAKIGFLGIGIMGAGMVDNLLKSGHEVTIWNRNNVKCRELVNEGALKGSDPAEVVQSCDIIFSCVSDGPALKDLVFGNCGVLQGISSGKGFVDLSTVDVESIQDVNEAIVTRGGRFLEAPVIGTKELSKNGQLLVLASGDKSLYDDCYSCFQAMGRHMLFLGEIASATRMKLVLSLLIGTTLAGLAESLALADKLGLSTEDVLRVFSYTSGSSPFLCEKGGDMIHNRLADPSCKLQIMAKDLRLSVNMSDTVDQPLHVGAAVCELFKKAKSKGYGEHDVAAVYRAADL